MGRSESQTEASGSASNPVRASNQGTPNPFASTLARDALLAYAHRVFKYPFQPLPLVAPILNVAQKNLPSTSPSHPYSSQLLPLLRGMKKLHPNHLPVLLLLGCVYHAVGDYEASIVEHNDILTIDSSFVEAISNIGTNFQALGRLKDAEVWWWKAIRIRPSFWDAVYNVLSVYFSPSPITSEDHPKARDAMHLCEFVQSEIVGYDGKLKCAIPPSDIPRLQNIFCISGNLRASFHPNFGEECLRDYGMAISIVLSIDGHGGYSIRHLILAACITGLSLCDAIPQDLNELANGQGVSLSPIDKDNAADTDLISFVKNTELDLLRVLCGPAKLLPAIFLSPEQASRMVSIILAPSKGFFPALCEKTQHGGGVMIPSVSVKDESSRVASFALLGIAKRLQENGAKGTRDSLFDGVFQPSPSLMLLLYYLTYAFSPSTSTCNNLGILLSTAPWTNSVSSKSFNAKNNFPQDLARTFYEIGLQMEEQNPHILVNLGSLIRESGDSDGAIKLYVRAIQAKPDFDVALTNLANAFKDMGRVSESIPYFRRAIEAKSASPLAEATSGLTHALASICDWRGFGTLNATQFIDNSGHLRQTSVRESHENWTDKIVSITSDQLQLSCRLNRGLVGNIGTKQEWMGWIQGALGFSVSPTEIQKCSAMLDEYYEPSPDSGSRNEGAFVLRIIEWLLKVLQWRWFSDAYGQLVRSTTALEPQYKGITAVHATKYRRPQIPATMLLQSTVSVLPFHTFIYPLDARLTRLIAHRSALRLSHTALASHWLPEHVFPPPAPQPRLNVGYISSDYTDHPTAHLMQSVFGFHNRERFHIYAYAITASDGSIYHKKIESDTESFRDVSSWSTQEVVEQIIRDEIHILVNLNGYTKDARNDIFAVRACPVQMSLLGFASTLGAGWCDYLVCDPVVCPPEMHRCQNCDLQDEGGLRLDFGSDFESPDDSWIYSEKLLYLPHSYLVTDHRHSFENLGFGSSMNLSDFEENWAQWEQERERLRLSLFEDISQDTIIFANFNQVISESIFVTWLKILKRVPSSILWLLRFPAEGEQHLLRTARDWGGPEIAERLRFTDVADKTEHIRRSFAADLFLDTTECNAHTTAVDILWAGVPMITWSKYKHKMCSRVGASAAYATGFGAQMVTDSSESYENRAVSLAEGKIAAIGKEGVLSELDTLRRGLCRSRTDMPLFDTERWTRNLEKGYERAWEIWVRGGSFLHFKTGALEQPYNCNGYIWVRDEE
ncbi:hypothetical protein SCHPADRAFT_826424 [Schizopora paradoxa]|uniref:protein O-GlcNAc transferase n=1 Tax=Schizopora paradoxa TaxID=27342 RepID=A0A0H2SC29_9AGAM|nr:hypothetical protein SCHPADRAFT_826424 [Schizopora paradoxa]